MKRKYSVACVLGVLLAVPAFGAEWVDITPDADLSSWVQRGGEAKYRVEDGVVIGTSVPNTDNSFLCTEKTYKNFILEFEFFGHPDLNSGVQIRSESRTDYKDGRVHGYQIELEDEAQDRDWSGGIYDEARRGWLHPKKDDEAAGKAFGEAGKKLWKNGEWNTIRVEAKGGSIKTWLNGEPRAELTDDLTLEGFVALQVHGVGGKETPMEIKWRNIRIQELDE